jgi:GNAT superfamily N-acetyltransferase
MSSGDESMKRIPNPFASFWRSVKTVGAARTVQRLIQRLIPSHLFDFNALVLIQTSMEIFLEESKDDPQNLNLGHRWASPQDLDLLTCGGLTPDQIREYFDAGGRVAVTTNTDGQIIGYNWSLLDYANSQGWMRFTYAPTDIWGAHNYVAPAYRGQRIAGQIRRFVYLQLQSEGYKRSAGLVETLNRSALQTWASPANRLLGALFFVRIGHFIVYRIGRKWGAGFYGGDRPFRLSTADFESISTKGQVVK